MEQIKGPDYLTNKSKKAENLDNLENKPKSGINRRNFLKRGGAIALGAALGIGFGKILDFVDKKEDLKDAEKGIEDRPTEEQEKIKEDDDRIIGKTIEEQLAKGEKVVLNLETKKALRKKWEKSYSKRPENCPESDKESGINHLGLLQSIERMQPWISGMKAEFKKIGLPEEFVYLAIPESHFKLDAYSQAKAKGPYQFTESTARAYNLKINNIIDERCDPIESARACAEHLKESFERFNNDWDLAFADYNGGYTNEYAKSRNQKKDRNYQDYLQWREDRINKFISEKNFEHKIEKGQNLTTISKIYKISIEVIKKENNLKNNNLKINQVLKIPEDNSSKINKLSSSLENLNYPEKFYAVLNVIRKEGLAEKFPAESIEFDLKETPKEKTTEFSHIIKKGEGLWVIARKYKEIAKKKNSEFSLSVLQIQSLIQRQNGISDYRKIYPKQKLKVILPLSNNSSLSRIAINHNLNVAELHKLNPGILNIEKSLSVGMKIRIPRG